MGGLSRKKKREGHYIPSPELSWEASGRVVRKSLGITLPPVSVAMTFRSESDGTCFPVSIRDSDGFDTPIRRDSSSSVMPFSSLYARSGFFMRRKLLYTQSLRQAKLRIGATTACCVWCNFLARNELKECCLVPRRVINDQPRQPNRIAEWRRFRNVRQDDLAEALGVTKASVSRVENGKAPYTQDFLEVTARTLKTDVASLLFRKPDDGPSPWGPLITAANARPTDRDKIIGFIGFVLSQP